MITSRIVLLIRLMAVALLATISGMLHPIGAQPAMPTPDWAVIDNYVNAQIRKHQLPGVALAITQGDRIVYARGYGTAGGDRPLTPSTPMYIGSSSKSFTALAIMQQVEQSKLNLDAPVRRYLPWFAVADSEASERLTVRHFLHHASGLSDAGFSTVLPENATLVQAVQALKDARLTAPIGTQSQYFNHNYDVLALIVETVSGQEFGAYVDEHIFGPLAMTHSYTSQAAAQTDGLAQGYSRFFGRAIPMRQPHPAYGLGEGFLIASADNLAHFVIAMNNGGAYGSTRILSPDGIRALHTPRLQAGFRYGMGWFVDSINGVPRIHHGGATETFKTFMDFYPSRKLGIVLMINEGYLVDHYISAEQLFGGVEQLVLGQGQPDVTAGYAVPQIGQLLLVFTLAVAAFQSWQLWRLRTWRERVQRMTVRRRAVDIGLNFLIPSAILAVIIWRLALFFGDRFNLVQQAVMLFRALPDIGVLMLVGTVPDYAQGVIKLWWLLRRTHWQGARTMTSRDGQSIPAPVVTRFPQVKEPSDLRSGR
ncbi:MAG TPA: serine hydrolase domain-containing protein [Herpetosiphonaceae bacterium]